MIITQGPQSIYPEPLTSRPLPSEPGPAVVDTADTAAKGGARGLSLLSGDAAAVVIAEQALQTAPAQEEAGSAAPAALDLRGRDLRQVDLTTLDLRGADLTDADMSGMDLTGLDLSGATLASARLDGANLTDTKLNGVNATGASFTQATIVRTDMNNGDFSEASFNDAYMSGLGKDEGPATAATLAQGKVLVVSSAVYEKADFSGATIRGQFTRSQLDNANFNQVAGHFNINKSSVRDVSFQGISGDIEFGTVDLSGSDFTNINSARVNIGQSAVDGVSFLGSSVKLGLADLDLRNVNLGVKDKDLSNSYLANNIMTGMNFSGYDFSGALIMTYGQQIQSTFQTGKSADLGDAVTGTNFTGANFTGAVFHDFDMRKALMDAGALDKAQMYVNQSDSRYSYISDIFKGVQSSEDAARALYSKPLQL